jgi:hypothetical protein
MSRVQIKYGNRYYRYPCKQFSYCSQIPYRAVPDFRYVLVILLRCLKMGMERVGFCLVKKFRLEVLVFGGS